MELVRPIYNNAKYIPYIYFKKAMLFFTIQSAKTTNLYLQNSSHSCMDLYPFKSSQKVKNTRFISNHTPILNVCVYDEYVKMIV